MNRFRVFILLTACVCLIASFSFAQNKLTVGKVSTNPGEKKSGFIVVPAGKDGPEHKIPVPVNRGKKAGPVLALIAGVHG